MDNQRSNQLLIKNTLMLYVRMFVTMAIGLFTSRVVLASLGKTDFGLYGVVAGVVTMMGFLNRSMAACTQRFLTFELGRNDMTRLNKVFCTSIQVHMLIAAIVVLVSETVGLWFLNHKMQIPVDRMHAAHWVFHCSVLSSVLAIMTVPYNAAIVAHERMSAFAYFSIAEVTLKLLIVYALYISPIDRLIAYSILMLAIPLLVFFLYYRYSKKRFEECHYSIVWDKEMNSSMLSFAGWDLFGNFSTIARTQGVNIILNMFFGAIVNAAAGVATQVQGAVMQFASNIITAVRPQMIKAYSNNDHDRVMELMTKAGMLVFLLLLTISAPLIVEMPYVLRIWLKDVPDFSTDFCRWTLLFNLGASLSMIVMIGIHATGRIKLPSIINGTLYMMVIPVSYLLYKMGSRPTIAFTYNTLAIFFVVLSNCMMLHNFYPQFSAIAFIKKVVIPDFAFLGTFLVILSLFSSLFDESFIRLLGACALSVMLAILSVFIILTKEERTHLFSIIKLRVNGNKSR